MVFPQRMNNDNSIQGKQIMPEDKNAPRRSITFKVLLSSLLILSTNSLAQKPVNSDVIKFNKENLLEYIPDNNGNIIPDFSYAGYKNNNEPIPKINIVHTISPIDGDNTNHIQAAIDKLATLPLQKNGFRGTLLLNKGEYPVAGQLLISQSGIVLRGTGQSENDTVIIATGQDKRSLIHVKGERKTKSQRSLQQKITTNYVPVGSHSFEVEDASRYKVGQELLVVRLATGQWIDDIGMNKLKPRKDGREIKQWTTKKYHLKYERTITAINNNTITIDVPLVQMIEDKYDGGVIYPISITGRVNHIGIENMRLVSEYRKGRINSDEKHAWNAIEMTDVENSWISDISAYHFARSLVAVQKGSRLITVRDSSNYDPASEIRGGRRYSYSLGGSLTLFLRCDARNGRHDYITSSRVAGPNAFVFGKATKTHSDIGPHHRWATGTLYDNIHGGDINAEDRQNLGSGHGWSGAQQVFWNTNGRGKSAVQSPPGAINWSIGHVGKRYKGRWSNRPQGVWISHGKHVKPQSLFVQQLTERLGLQHTNTILAKADYISKK